MKLGEGNRIMENIEVYATAVGTIIVVLTVVITMANECKGQIKGMYRRFDDHKKRMEDTHVSKELFSLVHKQLVVDISEIKTDVKTLLRNGKRK